MANDATITERLAETLQIVWDGDAMFEQEISTDEFCKGVDALLAEYAAMKTAGQLPEQQAADDAKRIIKAIKDCDPLMAKDPTDWEDATSIAQSVKRYILKVAKSAHRERLKGETP